MHWLLKPKLLNQILRATNHIIMADNILNSELQKAIIETLKNVFDPEIPVNIYELGLIYEINLDESHNAKIVMTLTTPNCPVAESMPTEVREAVKAIEGVNEVEVELTFEPPWDQDLISDAAKLDLGLL
jgi:FeS assembly SUF system protein